MGKLTEGTVRSVLMILRLKASQGIGILGHENRVKVKFVEDEFDTLHTYSKSSD